MPTFGVHFPDNSPLIPELERRAKMHDGKVSAYIRAAIVDSITGSTVDPSASDALEKWCERVRPEFALELQALLRKQKVNQTALIGKLLEALHVLLTRNAETGDRLYLVTESEVATLLGAHDASQLEKVSRITESFAPQARGVTRSYATPIRKDETGEHIATGQPRKRRTSA